MHFMVLFLWIFLILVALAVFAANIAYRITFFNRNVIQKDIYAIPPGDQYEKVAEAMLQQIHDIDQLPFEQICITARDGIKLAARYYHRKDGAPVQIQFHGYRGSAVREYAGGIRIAKKLGINSIVVDQRAHGLSGGHTISFGILERYDCADWVNYACRRFGNQTPIILSGVSMGAGTVLMASELDLPKNVVAIVADCPYSNQSAIIQKVCGDMKLPARLAYPFVALGALLFGRFRIWESDPVRAVKNTKIPILLIHGDEDRFVPFAMSKEIYEACASKKRLELVPSAGHGLCYLYDPERYCAVFTEFIRQCGVDV